MLKTEQDIINLLCADEWRMDILRLVRSLQLPDCWIGAGFVRNMVWDALHGRQKSTPLNDIDIIYFNPNDEPEEAERRLWRRLKDARPDVIWSVTNIARRHLKTGEAPYSSSTDTLSHWVETATCVGARLDEDDTVLLTVPHGIEDLVALRVRMNPLFPGGRQAYLDRQEKKQWQKIWPKLRVADRRMN